MIKVGKVIKAIRIDERLIHGQVAVTWCSALNVDSIVVANDKASQDEVSVISLKMAAPANVKVAIKNMEDSIEILSNPRIKTKNVLVLVTNPMDALKLIETVPDMPFVNVGNYGMIDEKEHNKILATSLAVTLEDIKYFEKIISIKPDSNYQMTPTLKPLMLKDLIK